MSKFTDITADHPPLDGFLHRPDASPADALILTHGAGANCRSPLLTALAEACCAAGLLVLRCDLPFRQLRPHGPPTRGSAERDQQGLRRAVELIRPLVPGRVFLGGHSYGGRQASMLAASEPGICDGLLLLSYPLHPPKRPDQLRTAHFPQLRTPALFVSGTRDGFGTTEELTEALKLIKATTRLLPVEQTGHELWTKRNTGELERMVVDAFATHFNVPHPEPSKPDNSA